MQNETKEQKEERRRAMMLNNPKKDWWAKRNNKTRIIGGVPIPANLLREAQRRRIEYMMRETIVGYGKFSFWQRTKGWFKKLWQKIKRG
jgi:hypothetical protein